MAGNVVRMIDKRPTFVYQCSCAHGGLLYVGIAHDLAARIRQHRSKPWWPHVDMVTAELYEDRAAARQVESHTIWHEHPTHNRVGYNGTATPCEYLTEHRPVSGGFRIFFREPDGQVCAE